jgi:alpha-tubulin suppressor-like RCC1 family protein
MAETTRKGVWDLQQVRDQILDNVWEQQNELYSWGGNGNGQLGQNTTTNVSSPVQIPGTTWSSISAGTEMLLATKTDGTLWAWGAGGNGRLGQNNTTSFHHQYKYQEPHGVLLVVVTAADGPFISNQD